MTWVKLDDGFAESEKVEPLHDRAFRLHIIALCYCSRNLTDGRLSPKAQNVCLAILGPGRNLRFVAELIDAGLWVRDGDDIHINDFLDYNPTSEQVKEERRKARERMRRLRARVSPEGSLERSPERSGTPTRPDPKSDLQDSDEGGELFDGEFHALRLFAAMRPQFQTEKAKREVMSYARKLPASEFQSVLDSLEKHRREVKNEASWVCAALSNRVRERSAA